MTPADLAADLFRAALVPAGKWVEGCRFEAYGRVVAIGMGKASAAMAAGLGLPGLVASKEPWLVPEGLELILGGHPLPNEASLRAGEEALALAASLGPGDLLVGLVSGGGSALMEALQPGLSLADLRHTTDLLLRSGAPIEDLNTVRKALSRIKNGGLLRAAARARVEVLVVSDVPGPVGMVASGPFWPGQSPAAGKEVLQRWGLWDEVPEPVRQACVGDSAPGEPPPHRLVADWRTAREAVLNRAAELGVALRADEGFVSENVEVLAPRIAARARQLGPGEAHAWFGEPTVRVRGPGLGGRAQELALRVAREIVAEPDLAFLAAGTDGTDGPTEAAGAVVTGHSWTATADAALATSDSHRWAVAEGCALRTGPTGTNVNDVMIAVRGRVAPQVT